MYCVYSVLWMAWRAWVKLQGMSANLLSIHLLDSILLLSTERGVPSLMTAVGWFVVKVTIDRVGQLTQSV